MAQASAEAGEGVVLELSGLLVLARLFQGEAESAAKRESEDAELATAIGQLEVFAERVRSGLLLNSCH